MTAKKTKIAILGGGMASLTAAYELTSLPDWKDKYEITVYQMGWRLGGKCASGRNEKEGWRLEEHGFHVLFGWYENTFGLIRECYQKLGLGEALDAFTPCEGIVAPVPVEDGQGRIHLESWPIQCSQAKGEPGSSWNDRRKLPPEEWASQKRGEVDELLRRILRWGAAVFRGIRYSKRGAPARAEAPVDWPGGRELPRNLKEAAGALKLPEEMLKLVNQSTTWFTLGSPDQERLDLMLDAFLERLRDDRWCDGLEIAKPATTRAIGRTIERIVIMASFCYTVAKGLFVHFLHKDRTWFDLDDYDLREWLESWKARPDAVSSPVVDAAYAAVFSSGRRGEAPRVAAGTILQGGFRAAFMHKGKAVYLPNGSIGEVVIAPMFLELRRRGVAFKFFQRVEELLLSKDRKRVEGIRIARQATVKKGDDEYSPLVPLEGHGQVWPSTPITSQLGKNDAQKGPELESWWGSQATDTYELVYGEDFDKIILGISIGALEDVFPAAMSDPEGQEWQMMIHALPTTQTQAMQLWYQKASGPTPRAPISIPGELPFDTVGDMSHVLGDKKRTLLYLCGPLPDSELPPERGDATYLMRQRTSVASNADHWLTKSAGPLLFRQVVPGAAPIERFTASPMNPSDRYVLCPPRSVNYRLRANGSRYENLVLAGDWIKTSVSSGCLEAATMGGIEAARAIDRRVPMAAGDWLPDLHEHRSRPTIARPPIAKEGTLMAPAPITLIVDEVVFPLRADEAKLRALCDKKLNLGKTKYRPLGPYVFFNAASITNVADPFGSADELDFAFWIPLVTSDERIVFYTPYVWVDSYVALMAGIQLFGFPKQEAKMVYAPDQGHFSVDTWVLRRPGGTLERQPVPLVDVHPVVASPGGKTWSVWDAFVDFLATVADCPRAILKGLRDTALSPRFQVVFLKESPDADPRRPTQYSGIIEAPMDIARRSFSWTTLKGTFEITLHEYQSHRIGRTLGLLGNVEPGLMRIRVVNPKRVKFRATLQPGTEKWRA